MAKKSNQPKTPNVAPVVPTILREVALARLNDTEGQMSLPVLYECMLPQYEGTKLLRTPGKLSIVPEGVYWRVTLDLPYERLTCRLYVESLTEVLTKMNEYLGSGKAIFSPGYDRTKKALPHLDDAIQ